MPLVASSSLNDGATSHDSTSAQRFKSENVITYDVNNTLIVWR